MNEFWTRLLGAPAGETGRIVGTQFQFQPVLGWGPGLLLLVLAAALGAWMYRPSRVPLPAQRRRTLAFLRAAALAGVAFLLLRPSLSLTLEGVVRQSLVLLFDESASLALRDPRTAAPDQVRAGIAEGKLPAGAGLDQRPPAPVRVKPSRLDLLRAALTNRELALVERLERNFNLKPAGFAGDLLPLALSPSPSSSRPIPTTTTTNSLASEPTPAAPTSTTNDTPLLSLAALASALHADGRESAPGNALREVLERERGRNLAGIVLFTDGLRNAGIDPREAARLAREAGVVLHTVGLGTTAPRDLQIAELNSPDVAFVRDEIPLGVRLRSRGLTGEVARVTLSLDGTSVETRETRLEADGDLSLSFKLTPEITGDFELAVEVPARPDEILAENNRVVRRLRVMDDRIRVLFLEQSPRWEFRYLQALLLRDRRVELKCLLYDGDPAITRGPGSPYLDAFPTRREDLFAYDLVIFGDVDPKNFTPAQLELLAEFVSRSGGSFLMVAGRRFSPWSYRDTALDRLLPVEFDRAPLDAPATALHDRPVRLVLTAEGRVSPLLRLAEDPAESLRRWEALAPLYWIAPVRRAKPAALVLVAEAAQEKPRAGATAAGPSDPPPSSTSSAASAADSTGEGIPVVALQQYGVGQSMFVGTDNTWRWRRNEGEQFFVSFWGRIVQRLAIQHLLSGSRRTQIALDRPAALPGERVGVSARVFNNAFEPIADPSVAARLEGPSRGALPAGQTNVALPASELALRAVPDQPGVYRGEIVAGTPGRYRLTVGLEAPATADFTVEDRLVEAGETALQADGLRELAAAAGGSFFREEDLHRLPEAVQGRTQHVRSRAAVELWSSPLAFVLLLALFSVEWILRKLWQLK